MGSRSLSLTDHDSICSPLRGLCSDRSNRVTSQGVGRLGHGRCMYLSRVSLQSKTKANVPSPLDTMPFASSATHRGSASQTAPRPRKRRVKRSLAEARPASDLRCEMAGAVPTEVGQNPSPDREISQASQDVSGQTLNSVVSDARHSDNEHSYGTQNAPPTMNPSFVILIALSYPALRYPECPWG